MTKIDLTKMVENRLNDCLISAMKSFMEDKYKNPLFDIYEEVVKSNCDELKLVIKEVLYDISIDKEFKATLREQAYSSLARSLVSFNQGVLDRELSILKQDQIFKAKMKILISECLNNKEGE